MSDFSENGDIPTFGGSDKAKAADFANYFCSYAQLYHQKQMLVDSNRMAAYHAAIIGNADVFKDKIVMDVGAGSGILAVWAAQAGARRVYAVEYTDMAKHATSLMKANGVADVVTVIQGAVEDIELPAEEALAAALTNCVVDEKVTDIQEQLLSTNSFVKTKNCSCVDIIISEWMGYFLLRESMLDSLIRARDKFLKPRTGLMFPSHATMYLAPISDEEERKKAVHEYSSAMSDWEEFVDSTRSVFGVNMEVLHSDFKREQKEYYLLSSQWAELNPDALLSAPHPVKTLDMATCTLSDAKGIAAADYGSKFDFDIVGPGSGRYDDANWEVDGPISGFAGWFSVDFKSRTDDEGKNLAPKIENPASLSTSPEHGYTHWGQQAFHFASCVPLIRGETARLKGTLEMTRSKENSRLYNCRFVFRTSRRKTGERKDGKVLMNGDIIEAVYQIP